MAHLERGGSLVFEVGKMHARTSVPQTVVFPLNRFRLRLLFHPGLVGPRQDVVQELVVSVLCTGENATTLAAQRRQPLREIRRDLHDAPRTRLRFSGGYFDHIGPNLAPVEHAHL